MTTRRALALVLLSPLSPGCLSTSPALQCESAPRMPEAPGARMTVVAETACRALPEAAARPLRVLPPGTPVQTVWAAEGHYLVVDGSDPCWVEAGTIAPQQATGTRGLPMLLAPILVAAGEALVKGTVDWLSGGSRNPACGVVKVLREEGERTLVQAADGSQGWVARTALATLSNVVAADTTGTAADLMEGGALPPENTGGLTVEALVVRPDGRPVRPDETLRLEEDYDIMVRCSTDCWVRITAEQPHHDAVCQYHPSHLDGFGSSVRLSGGRWARAELLPAGMHFRVSEPIGDHDIIRVEANAVGPYQYVSGGDRGEGCQGSNPVRDGALTGCSRGGGFSGAPACGEATTQRLQPQAAAIAEVRLLTSR